MNSEVANVLVSLGIQVQPQIILDLDCFSDYLSVSYDYAISKYFAHNFWFERFSHFFPSDEC